MSRLKYTHASKLDISRVKSGRGFRYFKNGRLLRSKKIVARLNALVLPPAWKSVHIASSPNAHLQATGIDAKGRKQYRYHEKWTEHRNETKFHRLVDFAKALPVIRSRIKQHLSQRGLHREKVLAAAVDVLQKTNIRVGNDIYAKTNRSYGLTTLTNSHAKVHGARIHLHFRAKSGKMREIDLTDPTLGKILKRCQELPGQHLFEYKDGEGMIRKVTSGQVNKYIHELCGDHFTAKDFRLWCGTIRAFELLKNCEQLSKTSEREWRKRHLGVIRQTAEFLGNTPAICEKYYIHPALFTADRAHRFSTLSRQRSNSGLTAVEAAAVALLKV